jgi:hypothetical protein
MECKIWFVCTLQKRREQLANEHNFVLQSQEFTLITLVGVPRQELTDGLPSAAVVWQAEATFLQRQPDLYPEHNVIAWEARYAERDGVILSRFEVLLPAHED